MSLDLPSTDVISRELVLFLRLRKRALRAREVYGPLAEIMKLSLHQLSLKRATKDGSLWHNYVQTAREQLCKNGYMHRQPLDSWSLTDAGRELGDKLEKWKTSSAEDFGL